MGQIICREQVAAISWGNARLYRPDDSRFVSPRAPDQHASGGADFVPHGQAMTGTGVYPVNLGRLGKPCRICGKVWFFRA
jgi:hypothetical protein